MDRDLNQWEHQLVEQARLGRSCHFPSVSDDPAQPVPVVRDWVLRRLISGLPLPGDSEARPPVVLSHLVAGGFVVDGDLIDLSNARYASGAALPSIVLSNVSFRRLDLSHAELRRVSLKECRFESLSLVGANLVGNLELRGIEAIDPDGICELRATKVFVDGRIWISNSTFRVPTRSFIPPDSTARFSIELADAKVGGEIRLMPAVVCEGGVSIRDAVIDSDLNISGAKLHCGETYALSGQTAHIKGNLIGNVIGERLKGAQRLETVGDLWLLGARIDGSISLQGVLLGAQLPAMGAAKPHSRNSRAIIFASGVCGGTIRITAHEFDDGDVIPSKLLTAIDLTDAKVGGSLLFGGAQIGSSSHYAIIGARCVISGRLLISSYVSRQSVVLALDILGCVDFQGSRIKEAVAFFGCAIRPEVGVAINFRGASFGEFAILPFGEEAGSPVVESEILATVNISSCRVDAHVNINASRIDANGELALNARDTQVRGDFIIDRLAGGKSGSPITINGWVSVENARIDGNFHVSRAQISTTHTTALHADSLYVGGGLKLAGQESETDDCLFTADGTVDFDNATIEKSVAIFGVVITAKGDTPSLSFREARVRGSFTIQSIDAEDRKNPATLHGLFSMWRLQVGSDLNISAVSASVADNPKLEKTVIELRFSRIGGNLAIDGRDADPAAVGVNGVLAMAGTAVDGITWFKSSLRLLGQPSVSLSGLKAGSDLQVDAQLSGRFSVMGSSVVAA